jgi:hypothetical protein
MSVERFKQIEINYEVESIKAKGQSVWPLIRFYLFVNYQSQVIPFQSKNLGIARKRKLIAQFFYGFTSYFRKHDYLAFSDSSERKLVDGKWVDKTVDYILENLPDALLIELPLPAHYKKSEIPTTFVASKLPLYALAKIYTALFLRKIKIENENILKDVIKELNINFDYLSILKKNIAQYKIGRILAYIYKPRWVIIQPSYTNSGFVKAFKDSGTPVVEVQHGLISESHEAYNPFKRFDNSYFPDYFLSYGERERDFFSGKNYLLSKDRVIPIGHYYLDHINTSRKSTKDIIPEVLNFSYGVSITGQNLPGTEEKFIEFMSEVARHTPQVCFFYIPRSDRSAIFQIYGIPKNLIITVQRDTYEVLRLTKFHTTIFSTCAIEAPALGTPNILVNINNLAKTHLHEVIENLSATVLVETVEEYIQALQDNISISKEKIINSSSYLIAADYKKNVKNFVNEKLLNQTDK